MNEYGDFRIVEPIHNDGLVTTYHASKVGADGSELFVLRVYRPPDAIMGSPRAAMDMVRFLEAGISHRDAAKEARHIVSVHDLGKANGGAYIVTNGFRTTLQSLIDYRIRLSADDLRILVEQIIRGLIEYQAKASRPHNNLIASTVMLNSLHDLASTPLALAEPGLAPASGADDKSLDAAALGRLIHALVEFRPAWAPIRWPVPPSEAWTRLGRSGERWRELTNRLLDPNAADKGDDLDLEDILRNLPIEPRDYRKPIGLSAAAIAFAALSGFLYWQFVYDPQITEEEIKPLRNNITSISQEHQVWLYQFKRSVSNDDPLAEFRAVAGLTEDVAYLDENVLGKIRDTTGKKYFKSGNYFPEVADNLNWTNVDQYVNGDKVDLTLFTRSQFEEIKEISDLILDLRDNYRTWKIENFSNQAEAFDKREWIEASKSLQSQIGDEDDPPDFDQLKDLLNVRVHLAAIDGLWEPIKNVDKEAPGKGETVLRRFQPSLQALMATLASVEAIHTELKKNQELVARMSDIATDEGSQIEWDLFEAAVSPPTEDTVEAFDAWSHEADSYRRLPPENRIDDQQYQTDLETLRVNISYLVDFEAPEDAERFGDHQLAVETAYQLVKDLDRIKKNKVILDNAITEILNLGTYAADCEEQYKIVAIPASEYLDERRQLTYQSPSLALSWSQAIDSVGSAEDLDSDRKQYGTARKRLKGVEDIFLHLDKTAFSFQAGDLPPQSKGWAPDAALDILSEKRELAIDRIASKIVTSDTPPTLEADAITQALAAEENTFGNWYAQAKRMFASYLDAERMFDEGHSPDEPDQASGETVLSLVSEWEVGQSESNAVLREFRPALTGIIDRIDLNRNMMTIDSPQEVMSIIEGRDPSFQPELYRTAWNRLGELSSANDVTAIHRDHQLLEALAGWLETFDENPRRQQAVKDRLESESHDRWVARLSQYPLPAHDKAEELDQYEAALGLHVPFQVRTRDLAAWMQWNLKLTEFRSTMMDLDKQDEHETEARKAARDLQSDLVAYGSTLTDLDAIKLMTADLDLIASDRKKTVDFTEIGPAGTDLKWTYDKTAEVRNVERPNRPPLEIVYRYTRSRQTKYHVELRFKLLDPDNHPALSDLVYVSTEEVSFKMFKHVAEHRSHTKNLVNIIELKSGIDDPRQGPRVWWQTLGVQRGIALESPKKWLVEDPKRLAEFPPNQGPRLQPSPEHPVQHVSAVVAIYVANALGCRLPTTVEFQSAIVEQYGDLDFPGMLVKINNKSFTGHIPNLRDVSFTTQLDFAVAARAEKPTLRSFTPENGSFHPDPDRNNSYSFNDNDLWFDYTSSDSSNGFQHLYGNVQEWVYDDPDAVTPAEGEPILPPREILVNLKVEHLGVIGGSALSSTEYSPPDRQIAKKLAIPEDLLKLTYADVGFRLVIAGKFDTVAQQVLAATSRGYVNLN